MNAVRWWQRAAGAPDGSVFADSRLEDACIHLDSCAECGGKVLVSGLGD
mgnify:CR=1 FL=1